MRPPKEGWFIILSACFQRITRCSEVRCIRSRMTGFGKDGWMSLVASTLGGTLFGVVATTIWWLRRGRRSRTVVGHGAKKIKVYHTATFRSARVAWMIAGIKLARVCASFIMTDKSLRLIGQLTKPVRPPVRRPHFQNPKLRDRGHANYRPPPSSTVHHPKFLCS